MITGSRSLATRQVFLTAEQKRLLVSWLPVSTVKMRVSSLSRGQLSSSMKVNIWPLRTTSSGPGYSWVWCAAPFLGRCQSTSVTLIAEQGEDREMRPGPGHVSHLCSPIHFSLPATLVRAPFILYGWFWFCVVAMLCKGSVNTELVSTEPSPLGKEQG